PPKEKLPAQVIANLTAWVQMGAPWPKDSKAAPLGPASRPAKGDRGAVNPGNVGPAADVKLDLPTLRASHWAWQQVKPVKVPAVADPTWAHGDIDRFIQAKHEEKGLHAVPDADRATLIRRVYFDLTGLPPSPSEVDAFVRDKSPDAFAKVVDKLLASPRFGEQWGRH